MFLWTFGPFWIYMLFKNKFYIIKISPILVFKLVSELRLIESIQLLIVFNYYIKFKVAILLLVGIEVFDSSVSFAIAWNRHNIESILCLNSFVIFVICYFKYYYLVTKFVEIRYYHCL